MDCKATVNIGAFSRGGQTRGDHKASDHDLGCKEKYIPCGIVDEDTAQLYVTFGSSSKTSDCIVDTLAAWWQGLSAQEQGEIDRVQINMDNGSESSGVWQQQRPLYPIPLRSYGRLDLTLQGSCRTSGLSLEHLLLILGLPLETYPCSTHKR